MRAQIRQFSAIFATAAYLVATVGGYSLHLAGVCTHDDAPHSVVSHGHHACGHSHTPAPGAPDHEPPSTPAHDPDSCVVCALHHAGQVLSLPASLPVVEPLCEAAPRYAPPAPVVEVRAAHRSRAPPV